MPPLFLWHLCVLRIWNRTLRFSFQECSTKNSSPVTLLPCSPPVLCCGICNSPPYPAAHSRQLQLEEETDHNTDLLFLAVPYCTLCCSIWNSTFMARSSYAVLPYCQALSKFPSHIQQVRRLGSLGSSAHI